MKSIWHFSFKKELAEIILTDTVILIAAEKEAGLRHMKYTIAAPWIYVLWDCVWRLCFCFHIVFLKDFSWVSGKECLNCLIQLWICFIKNLSYSQNGLSKDWIQSKTLKFYLWFYVINVLPILSSCWDALTKMKNYYIDLSVLSLGIDVKYHFLTFLMLISLS